MSTAKQLILHSCGENQVGESYESFFVAMLSPFAIFEVVLDESREVCDYRLVRYNPAFQKMLGAKDFELSQGLSKQTFLGGIVTGKQIGRAHV